MITNESEGEAAILNPPSGSNLGTAYIKKEGRKMRRGKKRGKRGMKRGAKRY